MTDVWGRDCPAWSRLCASHESNKPHPVCPNCGQWQHTARRPGAVVEYLECLNDCTERGLAPFVKIGG